MLQFFLVPVELAANDLPPEPKVQNTTTDYIQLLQPQSPKPLIQRIMEEPQVKTFLGKLYKKYPELQKDVKRVSEFLCGPEGERFVSALKESILPLIRRAEEG